MKPTKAEINELQEVLKSNIDKMVKSKSIREMFFLLDVCTNQLYDLMEAKIQEVGGEKTT